MGTHELTAAYVAGVKPDPHRDVTIFDGLIKGFGLRVKPSGAKTFFIQYRDPQGRQRRVALGAAKTTEKGGGLTVREARRKADIARGRIRDGQDPATEKAQTRSAKTVGELADDYLEANANHLKASTLSIERGNITSHIVPLLGRKTAKDLKRVDVEKFVADVRRGASARTTKTHGRGSPPRGGPGAAMRTLSTLHAILQRAVEHEIIGANPASRIRRPKRRKLKPAFSFDAVALVGKSLREGEARGEPTVGLDAVRFLLLTGFRKMEAMSLRVGAIDFGSHCARLVDSKTGPQIRPLGSAALTLLHSIIPAGARPKDPVFPGITSKGGHYTGIRRAWDSVAERAGIEGVTIHGLRHWFASAGAAMNYSDIIIGPLLGHAAKGVTGMYATAPLSALVAAADAISERLSENLS